MQTVREEDTLWSYWVVHEQNPDGTLGPVIDLSDATVDVEVVLQVNGRAVGAAISLGGEVSDPLEGRFRHKYDTLAPGVYFLTATFDSAAGQGTAPTTRNALLRVVARL